MTGPQSSGPISATVNGSGSVSASAIKTRIIAPRNFPNTSSIGAVGEVSSSSSVPPRRSSAQARIVSAATRKISSTGIHWNSGRTSARLRSKKVATQKKMNRVTPRKAASNRTAAGEAKKPVSSRLAMRLILRSMGDLLPGIEGIHFREQRLERALLARQAIKRKACFIQCAAYRRSRSLVGLQGIVVAAGIARQELHLTHSCDLTQHRGGRAFRPIERHQ